MNIQEQIIQCKKQIQEFEAKTKDNKYIFSFEDIFAMGYWKGRLSALEEMK